MMRYVDKNCSVCGIALTNVHFLTSKCSDCKAEARKAYEREKSRRRRENPVFVEKERLRKRAWYEANRQSVLEQMKAYRTANLEKVREAHRKSDQKHADEIRERRRQKRAEKQSSMLPRPTQEHKPVTKTTDNKPDIMDALRQVVAEMLKCPRLHLRAKSLPCGVDMLLCRGCPKCKAA